MPSEAYGRGYGPANVLNQVSSMAGSALAWNANGNLAGDGVNTYGWTLGNRLVSVSRPGMTATYAYDAEDRRTVRIVDGVMTRTLWSGADELAELDANGMVLRRFIPDGSGAMDGRLATVEANNTIHWHHTDHQGSVIATSNAAGQLVSAANYSPHGELGTAPDGTPLTAPPTGSPFGYTGRQHDPESGLWQYRARYYHPRVGTFLAQDPVGTQDDPNLYMYVGLDPVNMTDPTGKVACETVSTCQRYWDELGDRTTPIQARRNFDYLWPIVRQNLADLILVRGLNRSLVAHAPNRQPIRVAPNPDGSRGGPAHRDTVNRRIQELEDEGMTHLNGGSRPEEVVRTPGGFRESRRPDLTMGRPDGTIHRENVGRQTRRGQPVARERRAQQDIEGATGQCSFTAYNCR